MKYFLISLFGLIFSGAFSVTAGAQGSETQQYLAGYEQAQVSGDIVTAAKYALELTQSDFSQAPLTALEIRNLKTGLVETITNAGMLKDATAILGRLVEEDKRYLVREVDPVIRSDIRSGMVDRLTTLADIYNGLGADKRALKAYQDAHIVLQDVSKFEIASLGNAVVSTGASDRAVRNLATSNDEVTRQYPDKYKGMGTQSTLYVTAKIVGLLQGQLELNRQARNVEASIETLSLIQFYTEFQCGGVSECSNWVRGTAPPSLRALRDDLATEWIKFAIPEDSFRDLVCATGGLSDALNLGLTERYAKVLAQSWVITGDTKVAATQDYEALQEAKKLLKDVPKSDSVHACLIKLQALVQQAAADKQVRFLPITYQAMTSQVVLGDPNFETLKVFYGTNRNLDNVDKPDKTFGRKRGAVSYGWIEMTVPKNRAVGAVPAPGFLDFGGAKDGVHIVLSRVDRTDDESVFSSEFARSVAQSSRSEKEAFVFIHGHGVSFDDSARRAAQLAVDLDIRHGAAFYSWPAGSIATGYTVSEGNVKISVAPLKYFLTILAEESGADKIHLIAHSMGNRILLEALQQMNDTPEPMFDQVVWASPDVDAQHFGQSIGGVADKAKGMTLYASQHDRALKLSRWLHGKYPRAGQAPPLLEVTNAGDVITAVDTSEVARRSKDFIAHADYAGGAIIDLRSIVWLSLAPDARKCTIIKTDTAPYWQADSPAECPAREYGLALSQVRLNGLAGARRVVAAKIEEFQSSEAWGDVQTYQTVARILDAPQFVWE